MAIPIRVLVKLPGPVPTAIGVEVGGAGGRLTQQGVDVLEQGAGDRRALAEQLAVVDERARGDVSRGVEGQDEHLRCLVAAPRRRS